MRLAAAACLAAWLALGPASPARAVNDELAPLIQRLKPSVVVVGSYRELDNPRFTLRGSGFVVGDGNTVATNAHVIQTTPGDSAAGAALAVYIDPGRPEASMRSATVIEIDKVHDLALLRIEGPALPSVKLRESDSAVEGQSIAFMGFPIGGALGFSPVTHRGMISSITPVALPTSAAGQLDGNAVSRLREGSFRIFQLDATAYPGNSGGPLFDAGSGDVIGLVNMVAIKGTKETALTHPSGISYAVPASYLVRLIDKARRKQ